MSSKAKDIFQITLNNGSTYAVEVIEFKGPLVITTLPSKKGMPVKIHAAEYVYTMLEGEKTKQLMTMMFLRVEHREGYGEVAVFKVSAKAEREKVRTAFRKSTHIKTNAKIEDDEGNITVFPVEILDISATGCRVRKIGSTWKEEELDRYFEIELITNAAVVPITCKVVRLIHDNKTTQAGCLCIFTQNTFEVEQAVQKFVFWLELRG